MQQFKKSNRALKISIFRNSEKQYIIIQFKIKMLTLTILENVISLEGEY